MNRMRILLPFILLTTFLGCGNPGDSKTVSMKIGTKTYELEVADTEPTREHGLMERDTLAADHGMIFVFEKPDKQSFWMHHCRFDLDILFVSENGKVLTTATMKAYDESTTNCDQLVKYAIEIAAGQLKENGIKVGDTLKIPETVVPATASTTRP